MDVQKPRRVGLFVTCLVDFHRPSVGFAAIRLLEEAGCLVEVPLAQTCCGQPAYNSGDRRTARAMAQGLIEAFGGFDYVVAPSGSCAGMLRRHLGGLFEDDPDLRTRADALAGKCWELVSFLTEVCGVSTVGSGFAGAVVYHDGCSGLRELGVRAQPRALLGSMPGVTVAELPNRDVCCGFGGTFCVKYPEISTRMAADKVAEIKASGAATLLAGDLGCLLNLAGRLSREGSAIEVRHVAEVLAGIEAPAIGK